MRNKSRETKKNNQAKGLSRESDKKNTLQYILENVEVLFQATSSFFFI
jgi:hypothetical protein